MSVVDPSKEFVGRRALVTGSRAVGSPRIAPQQIIGYIGKVSVDTEFIQRSDPLQQLLDLARAPQALLKTARARPQRQDHHHPTEP